MGVRTSPKVERGGVLNLCVGVGAPIGQFVFAEFEGHSFLFARLQRDALEAFQFTHGTGIHSMGLPSGEWVVLRA